MIMKNSSKKIDILLKRRKDAGKFKKQFKVWLRPEAIQSMFIFIVTATGKEKKSWRNSGMVVQQQ